MLMLAMIGLGTLSGCGVQRQFSANDARQRYEKSSADYRTCLAQNAANLRACDSARLIMENDEREYHNLRNDGTESLVMRSR